MLTATATATTTATAFLRLGEDDISEAEELQRRCSGDVKPKRLRLSVGGDEEVGDTGAEEGLELLAGPRSHVPIHTKSIWEDPDTCDKKSSIAVLLPSGVEPGQFSARVVDEGMFLEVKVVWPSVLTDPSLLHKKWLSRGQFARYHPRLIGFMSSLKNLRSKINSDIESTARIVLPFRVQTHMLNKWHLGWTCDSARVIYVNLSAEADEYAITNDRKPYEIS